MTHSERSFRGWWWLSAIATLSLVCLASGDSPAPAGPRVTLDASGTSPRKLEPLTQTAVIRDYGRAWQNIADAGDRGDASLLGGLFVGAAQQALEERIADEQRTGVRVHYGNQSHQLKTLFYAPEGDVIELEDTMNGDVQVNDGSKTIHAEHTTLRYIVLMTPGVDRWVVRQLQAVPGS